MGRFRRNIPRFVATKPNPTMAIVRFYVDKFPY